MAGSPFGRMAKALEARANAWATKCLTAEEYAEAAEFDRRFKRDFWRWLGYAVLVAGILAVLAVAIWPQLTFPRAILFSLLAVAYGVAGTASAWYGYRKYTRHPAWMVLAIFLALLLVGAATGYAIGNMTAGRALADIDPGRASKAVAIAVLVGIVMAGVLLGIAQMRLREANLKAARLQAEAERERLARQGTQAELKLLQAQVEPHFLFNTLSNVRYLVQTGSPDALALLDHLIHYLRTALPDIRTEASTLGREAELARAYLEIMKLRMGGALDFTVDVAPELANLPFPPLMVITLVENAIKHGVAPLGRGRVAVRAVEEGGVVRVEVDDDGRGIGGTIGQGLGLANLRERLRALYGERARLDLAARDPAGARAVIEVPA